MRKVWHQENGKLVPGPARRRVPSNLNVMADIAPYRTLSGEYISGRAAHREMLRRTGKIELGNDYEAYCAAQRAAPDPTPQEIGRDMKEAIEMCRAGKGEKPGRLEDCLREDIDLSHVEKV